MAAVDWHGLLASLAVVAFVTLAWIHGQDYLPRSWAGRKPLLFGLTMGIGAIVAMLTSTRPAPGVIFDLRATFVAMSFFFGGPLAGAITLVLALAFRLALGGIGVATGVTVIIASATAGLAGRGALDRREPARWHVIVLALVIASLSLAAGAFLPSGLFPGTLLWYAAAAALVFAGTLLAGLVILADHRRRRAEAQNALYNAIIEQLPDCLNVKDRAGRFCAVNPATARLLRADSSTGMIGKSDLDYFPAEVAARLKADEDAVFAAGVPRVIEQSFLFADGSKTWVATLKAPLIGPHGEITGMVNHTRDITEQKRLRDALDLAQHRLDDAMECMAEGLAMFDEAGTLLLCNRRYGELFPMTADLRVPGAKFTDVLRAAVARGEVAVPESELEEWLKACNEHMRVPGERLVRLADGRWLEVQTRRTNGGALAVVTDITDKKRVEDDLSSAVRQLEALASTDGLTGLTNRRMFNQVLERELARSQRDGAPLSLLLIDVDSFKAFNDTYGHPAGDDCLRLLSHVLRSVLRRPGDVAARYGGEELAAVLPNTDTAGAGKLAEDYRTMVRDLRLAHSGSLHGIVTVSIGVATIDSLSINRLPRDLLRQADQALYAAKGAGRNRVMQARAA